MAAAAAVGLWLTASRPGGTVTFRCTDLGVLSATPPPPALDAGDLAGVILGDVACCRMRAFFDMCIAMSLAFLDMTPMPMSGLSLASGDRGDGVGGPFFSALLCGALLFGTLGWGAQQKGKRGQCPVSN